MHVGGDDPQHIVLAAGDGGALDHFGPVGDRRLENFQVLGRGQVQLDDGIDLEVETQLFGIQQGDPLADIAGILQSLDAPPAGRGRQAHLFGHVGNRKPGIVLQDVEDAGVDGVQFVGQCISPDLVSAQ